MLIDLVTGATRPVIERSPTASSATAPWDGILLEHHETLGELELDNVAVPDAVVVVQLAPKKTFEWRDSKGNRELTFLRGQLHVLPAMYPFAVRARQSGDFLSVSVESRFLRCAAHDLCRGPERMELTHRAPLDDPLLREIAISLKREIDAGYPGGKLYGESLASAMAVHLVRHYSNLASSNRNAGLGSGPGPLRQQIREAVYYIHEHYAAEISLSTLARLAGLSPFHFARLFRESTGLAPHQYVIQCRIERARNLLLAGEQTTAQIAVAVGFCDQSHLTTHFKRVFGLTPKKFRQQAGVRTAS